MEKILTSKKSKEEMIQWLWFELEMACEEAGETEYHDKYGLHELYKNRMHSYELLFYSLDIINISNHDEYVEFQEHMRAMRNRGREKGRKKMVQNDE